MGEGSNTIDKYKDKSKSIKRVGGEHDSSRVNQKKKKVLIKDYHSMIEMEIALKKKQPTKVCGSMLIGEFLIKVEKQLIKWLKKKRTTKMQNLKKK